MPLTHELLQRLVKKLQIRLALTPAFPTQFMRPQILSLMSLDRGSRWYKDPISVVRRESHIPCMITCPYWPFFPSVYRQSAATGLVRTSHILKINLLFHPPHTDLEIRVMRATGKSLMSRRAAHFT